VVVSADLGAGRATVTSPPGVSAVTDRRWHSVRVRLDRADVQLILDDVFESRATLPGDFVELNIDVGLIMGQDTAEQTTQLTRASFRGCLRSVMLDSRDLLVVARRVRSSSASQSTGVTWNRLKMRLQEFGVG